MTKNSNKAWRERQNKAYLNVLNNILAEETTSKVYTDSQLIKELRKRGIFATKTNLYDIRTANEIPAAFIRRQNLFSKQAKGKK